MTEAFFVIKEDEGKQDIRASFALIVRSMEDTPHNLDTMKEELIKNLREMCSDKFEEIDDQEVEVVGRPGRLIISKGTLANPVTGVNEDMVFVYNYVLTNRLTILVAFSSVPELWTEKWNQAKSYIDKLYFS